MANTLLTPTMITREILALLRNDLTFAKGCNRDWSKEFAQEGNKVGDTVNVRVPAMYTVNDGAAMSNAGAGDPYTETKVPVRLTSQKHVDISFSTAELALSMDDFSKRVLTNAVAALANKIDLDGLTMAAKRTTHFTGKVGTTLAADVTNQMPAYLRARAFMTQEGYQGSKKLAACLDPFAQVPALTALSGLFNKSGSISDQYSSGNLGDALGFSFGVDANSVALTPLVYTGSPSSPTFSTDTRTSVSLWNDALAGQLTTNPWLADSGTTGVLGTTASNGGATLTITTSAFGAGPAAVTFKAGTIITIANVYAVNPQSRVSTGKLRRFCVMADSSPILQSTTGTLTILPVPVQTGPYATVVVAATSATAVVTVGSPSTDTSEPWALTSTHAVNLVYAPEAFTLATANLEMPNDVHFKAQETDPQLGISVRVLRQYTIANDQLPCRVDVLYGWACPRPQLSCMVFT